MKSSRILASTVGVVLVAGSTLLTAGAANAADGDYYSSADFGTETSPYSAGWFTGGGSVGSLADSPSGLVVTGTTNVYQILNGTPVSGEQNLFELGSSAGLWVTEGEAFYQISVFGEPGQTDQQFTTLRPVAASTPGNPYLGTEQWQTSQAFGPFAANEVASLGQFTAELEAGVAPSILAHGAVVNIGSTATIGSIGWDSTMEYFLPTESTATVTPSTITTAALAATGVTVTLTGFAAGEPVGTGFGDGGSGGPADDVSRVADASGAVTFTFQRADVTAGTYSIGAFGEYSGVGSFAELQVVAAAVAAPAAPAAPAATELAATGTDVTGGLLAAGALLLAGIGAVVLRRRSATKA